MVTSVSSISVRHMISTDIHVDDYLQTLVLCWSATYDFGSDPTRQIRDVKMTSYEHFYDVTSTPCVCWVVISLESLVLYEKPFNQKY